LLIFALKVVTQVSSLWSRVIIVPLSLLAILVRSVSNTFSSVLIIIYVIIFIRGLLVLIVRVASISSSEQGYSLTKLIILFSLIRAIPLGTEFGHRSMSNNLIIRILWFEHQSWGFVFILILLLVSLVVLTYFLQFFKRMTRRI